jgi:sugar/nucleoside kinase (ribokinase family)
MKLLVIGHSVLDFIKDSEADKISAGGIFYAVSALNRICNKDDEIFLCTQYDEESFKYFKPEYDKIKKDYLQKVEKIPRVHLNLFTDKERHEYYENITNNLKTDFTDLKELDGILINMITGFDITLEQLCKIRDHYAGVIYIDVHTLSRGLGDNYKREFRRIPDFNNWAKNVDVIQVNQSELFTLSDRNTEVEIISEIFSYGVKILCVTKGDIGAKIYFKKSKEIISYFIAAQKIKNPNVIGCGDVFGASFFYSYIRNKNEIDSLNQAVALSEKHVSNKLFNSV